jgi:hypothetical protein
VTEFLASSFAGINDKKESERLESGFSRPDIPGVQQTPVEFESATNADVDDSGELSMRAGTTQKIAGSFTSLWSDGDTALAVKDGSLHQVMPDLSTTTELVSSIGASVAYESVGGKIYWTDGGATGVIDNGVSRSWGLPTPPIPVTLVVGTGSLVGGSYIVALTYTGKDGQESGSSMPVSAVVVADGSISITWDATSLDSNINTVRMYVSEPNGSTLFFANSVMASAGSMTFSGGIQGKMLSTQWLVKPPAGDALSNYKGSILIASGQYLYATTSLGRELCDITQFKAIDGTQITMLKSVETALFIGTELGVYSLTGDTFKNMDLTFRKKGTVVKGTAIVDDGFSVLGSAELSGKQICLFTMVDGVVVGLPDGTVVPLTESAYNMDTGVSGAAVFKNDPTNHQYLVFQQS